MKGCLILTFFSLEHYIFSSFYLYFDEIKTQDGVSKFKLKSGFPQLYEKTLVLSEKEISIIHVSISLFVFPTNYYL